MENKFFEFLCNLPADGETLLLTKKVKSGAFPAFLPSQWNKRGAWYANTGCYIIDRFDGKLSCSADKIEHVLVLVCDDVGTKSKTPPIPPTWIMETSEGNQQWGYAFGVDDQPRKGKYCALYNAVAAAGYSDPGANNPVRNFRLPGSLHKTGFQARLVEFHPDRFFTPAGIEVGFDVKPGEEQAEHKRIRIADDGGDVVLKWLSDNGHLLDKGNSAGWWGVTCPNQAMHTDGEGESRYTPSTRSWTCFHTNCLHLKSKDFLQWVASSGGPDVTTGLREELLAAVMAGALAKLDPASSFTETADDVIAEVELREAGRVSQSEWHGRFAYVLNDNAYFDLTQRFEVDRAGFDALYRGVKCNSIHGLKPKVSASVWFDENRDAKGGRVLHGITYAAGDTALCVRDGMVYGNRWIDARPVGTEGDVSPWLAHIEALLPEKFEREHLLDVMAFKLQYPRVKINHAVLIGGVPGVGKDTLIYPFIWAVCGPYGKNKGLVDTKILESQWGYGMESEIMVVNELRPDQFKDRRALENILKPIIAAPPDEIMVNRKGLHPYAAANRLLVMATSNHRDAIALPSDDRRWFCLWAEGEWRNCKHLWDWYLSGGLGYCAGWLMKRDVSGFNPAERPPMTEAKMIMLEQARSGAEAFLVDYISSGLGDFGAGVIGAPFHLIIDRIQAPEGLKISASVLMHSLTEAGWIDQGRVHSADYPTCKRIFARRGLAMSKSEMRRAIEEKPLTGGKLVAVK